MRITPQLGSSSLSSCSVTEREGRAGTSKAHRGQKDYLCMSGSTQHTCRLLVDGEHFAVGAIDHAGHHALVHQRLSLRRHFASQAAQEGCNLLFVRVVHVAIRIFWAAARLLQAVGMQLQIREVDQVAHLHRHRSCAHHRECSRDSSLWCMSGHTQIGSESANVPDRAFQRRESSLRFVNRPSSGGIAPGCKGNV